MTRSPTLIARPRKCKPTPMQADSHGHAPCEARGRCYPSQLLQSRSLRLAMSPILGPALLGRRPGHKARPLSLPAAALSRASPGPRPPAPSRSSRATGSHRLRLVLARHRCRGQHARGALRRERALGQLWAASMSSRATAAQVHTARGRPIAALAQRSRCAWTRVQAPAPAGPPKPASARQTALQPAGCAPAAPTFPGPYLPFCKCLFPHRP